MKRRPAERVGSEERGAFEPVCGKCGHGFVYADFCVLCEKPREMKVMPKKALVVEAALWGFALAILLLASFKYLPW